jgi:hypothetical protein
MGQVIKLEDFSGLIPRMSPRLLPVNAGTRARNTKLLNGELRGFRAMREVANLNYEPFTVRRAYRLQYVDQYSGPSEHWLAFNSRDVDVVRSPIVNDQFDRYYWAGDGRPKYNPLERIVQGQDPLWLGVPAPLTAPVVTPAAGTESTRAYLVTFVSAYGEESGPSPPVVATGDPGTWVISSLPTSVANSSNRNVTRKRIYRTVPGNNSALYFFVAEMDLAVTSYNDSAADDVVVLNNTLESVSWAEPPAGLQGFVVMPNGYLVGWVGRRLCFSEPYRPHAWPAEYELSTEFEIVGLVVWGSTLVIGTKSQPYIGQGVSPASFTMQKMDAVEPCLSRRGMVATVVGAYYPSINGLTLVNSSGVVNITQDIVTKEEWARYNPANLFAAQLGLQYIAFNGPNFGFIFNPTEPKTKLVELDRFAEINGIETDKYTGNVNLISSDRVYDWDPEDVERVWWRWRSKEFHIPKPNNFGAVKIKFDTARYNISDDVTALYGSYNAERFDDGALNTLNGHPLNEAQIIYEADQETPADYDPLLPQWRTPLGGGPMYPLLLLGAQVAAVRFIVYINSGDGQGMVKVFDRIVYDEDIIRLPTGFKRDVWQFEMISNTHVYSVTIAETGKELARA